MSRSLALNTTQLMIVSIKLNIAPKFGIHLTINKNEKNSIYRCPNSNSHNGIQYWHLV
jgi:hypothetical protein